VQAVAQPGSGKTLGYLLPGAERLREAGHGSASRPDGPVMLVITPTRHAGPRLGTVLHLRSAVQVEQMTKESLHAVRHRPAGNQTVLERRHWREKPLTQLL
jgi:Rad3-related DNA helicase